MKYAGVFLFSLLSIIFFIYHDDEFINIDKELIRYYVKNHLDYAIILALVVYIIFLKKYLYFKHKAFTKKFYDKNFTLQNINNADIAYLLIEKTNNNRIISSPKIKEMFFLSEFNDDILKDIIHWFDEESSDILKNIINLKKDYPQPVLLSKNTSSYSIFIECYYKYNAENNSLMIWFIDCTEKEKKLRAQEIEHENVKKNIKKLSVILNAAPFAIWQRNKDLKIQYCNLEYNRIVEESFGKNTDNNDLELYKSAPKFASKVLRENQLLDCNKYIIDHGKRIYYKIFETPIEQDEGTAGFAVKMEELDKVRKELKVHISAQSELLESSSNATAIYSSDKRLAYYNRAFVKLTTLEERFLEQSPTYLEILDEMRIKRVLPEQIDFKAFKEKQSDLFYQVIESSHNEFFYLPDGRTLSVIVLPHALGGLLFTYEDITDYLALESSYKTLYEVNKATIDNLHEAVAVFGPDGKLKLSNINYNSLWQLDIDLINSKPHITNILENSKYLFYNSDNEELWNSRKTEIISQLFSSNINKSQIELTNGKVINRMSIPLPDGAVLVTFLDVTDSTLVERSLREKNEALKSADRIKSEFLSNVSYELRVPLTTIIGFSEILLNETHGKLNNKQKEYTKGVFKASQSLLNLINDILDIISIESGDVKIEYNTFCIKQAIEDVLKMIKYKIEDHQHELIFKYPEHLDNINADKRKFKQIIFKLLLNSIKYTPDKGKITVGIENIDNNTIKVFIEDNGIGISVDEQKYVFDKFYKTKESIKFNKSGTGLGLALAKSFTELLDGTVELKSEENKGTIVTCIFKKNIRKKIIKEKN